MAETESRASLFLGVDITIHLLTFGLVSLRVGYRWWKSTISLSDYMIIAAELCAMIHLILDIVICVDFGYGQHEADLPVELRNSWKTLLVFWLIQIFTKFPLMFSKLSLCLVYRDVLTMADTPIVNVSRIVNYVTMCIIVGFFTAATFAGIFACNPIYKSWLVTTPGSCIDIQVTFNYVTSSINILTSILVIGIPLPVLFSSKNKRIELKQLIALVLLGLVDTIISCIRLYMIKDLITVKTDMTWLVIPTHLVITIEYNVTIIAACLVVMRPCFQAIFNLCFPNSRHNTNNSSHGLDGAYGARSGYILSSNIPRHKGNSEHSMSDDMKGIRKTTDIELNSRSVSTEDILKSRDRF